MGANLGKHKITVDTAALASGDSLAAYLTSAAGTLLTHTSLGGKERLDVMSPSEFAEDAAHSSGDYGQFVLAVRNDAGGSLAGTDGDYAPLQLDASGNLRIVGTVTVNGQFAEDSAHISGDTGIQMLAVRKDAQGSNVGADGDYASLLQWSEGSLKVVDISNGSILQQQVAVAATATAIPAAALANRKSLMIQNDGSNSIFIGSATVTAAGATKGIEVPKGGFIELEVGPAVTVYGITAAGSVNVNVLEMA